MYVKIKHPECSTEKQKDVRYIGEDKGNRSCSERG